MALAALLNKFSFQVYYMKKVYEEIPLLSRSHMNQESSRYERSVHNVRKSLINFLKLTRINLYM